MTAHPDLLENDIVQMVEYILSLDDAAQQKRYSPKSLFFQSSCGAGYQCPLPGAITRVYDVPLNTQAVPAMPNKKPRQAGIKIILTT